MTMMCSWNYSKRFLFIGFLAFTTGYLLVLIFSRGPSVGSLEFPSYRLVNQWYNGGEFSAFVASDTGNVVRVPVLNTSNYEFVPSLFKVDDDYVHKLLRHSSRLAVLFSIEFHSLLQSDNSSNTHFSCRCGRVSDPCVCCGLVSAPELGKNVAGDYPVRQIVLQPSESTGKVESLRVVASPPGLCVNITYRPKTGKIHLAAVLLSSLDASFSSQLHKGDTAQEKPHAPANRLVLFDKLLSSPLANPPTVCAENHLNGADVALCVNLTGLSYIYDAGTEHKTAFVGCGRVQVILHRAYIVSDYGRFCFRAHRGAVDDADQKAAAGAAAPLVAPGNQVVGGAPISAGGPAVDEKKAVGAAPEAKVVTGFVKPPTVEEQIKPPPGILQVETGEARKEHDVVAGTNSKPKPIAGPLDHNNLGIP